MRIRTIITIILSALLASACGTMKIVSGQDTRRDSVRVEYRTERIERIDTVYIELPQAAERVVMKDTLSRLENDYAVSEAGIDTAGYLHHSLETKRRKVPVPVTATTERRDSIIYRDRDVYVEKPVEVEVEKKLTAWQSFRLKAFWMLVAALAIAFRRPLLSLIKKIIVLLA